MERDIFLNLSTENILDLVKRKGRPRVGVFVPDGNRRLVLATTNLQEDTPEFFNELIYKQTSAYLDTLDIFFSHGLATLFLPLFSRSVLSRSSSYIQWVAVETIKFICMNEQCLNFYQSRNIRIRAYGDISVVNGTALSKAKNWIAEVQDYTERNTTHTIYIGIGGEPVVGDDTAKSAIQYYKNFHQEPSQEELINFMYGQSVAPADFFIMSTKLAGLGALPGLICGHDTKVYYLPAPGVIAFNKGTYRMILYDLLFRNPDTKFYRLSDEERKQLNSWYVGHSNQVLGTGKLIGSVWIPQCYDDGIAMNDYH